MVIVHGTHWRERCLRQRRRTALYLLNFLFTLHVALVSYYISTFLVLRGFPQEFVGIVYSTGAMVMLGAIAYAPHILKKYGNYSNLLALGLMEFLVYIAFAHVTYLPILFLLFLVALVVPTLIAYSLDIFLEKSTENTHTGGTRGIFLSVSAVAWLAAPVVGGVLVERGGYTLLFTVAAVVFSPFIIIAAGRLKDFRDPTYRELNTHALAYLLKTNIRLRGVFVIQFLFRFFYAIMFVYLPLYVHGVLGMPISYIGILIAVASVAFILIEIPLGRILDRYENESDMLVLGSFVIGVTTIALSFIPSPSLWWWLPALFATRVGAAILEVGSESYFFKQIGTEHADAISAFRMLYPLSYIIAPLLGTLFLFFAPIQYIFVGLGIVMLFGIPAAALLKTAR